MNVDRLMSDIDILMPTLLNQRSSSSSNTASSSLSTRTHMMSSHSFFLAQQHAKLSIDAAVSTDVKVSWIDDSTEAERLRQYQLHNLDEMTQIDDDY